MVHYVRGRVHYVKEDGGLIWFHIYSWYGRGWVSISKNIFDRGMKKRLIRVVYGSGNRRIERHIKILEKEAHRLRRRGKDVEARSKEHHIHALRLSIKKELHVHDLVGRKVTFRID
jgi:hypothetical protein